MKSAVYNSRNLNESQLLYHKRFSHTCDHLCSILNKFNFDITASNARGLEKFATLTRDQQIKILTGLDSTVAFFERAIAQEIDLERDHEQLMWFALKEYDFIPHSNLIHEIKPRMSVEIYNSDSIQIFRSLNLLKFLTYTLSEILSFEWWELFSRNTFAESEMHRWALKIFSGEVHDLQSTSIPAHEVSEILGGNTRFSGIMEHHFFCPLKDRSGRLAGALSAFTVYPSWEDFKSHQRA